MLTLYFQAEDSSEVNKVKIQYPAHDLSREQVKAAADGIEKSRVFDFGALDAPYHLVKADYYSRKKRFLIN